MNDKIIKSLSALCAVVTGVTVLLILLFLFLESRGALESVGVWRFFSDSSWVPEVDGSAGEFNLIPMLVGSLLVTAISVVIAAPLGILSAICISCYAPKRLQFYLKRVVELLAGIPSVVYGVWGLVVLVPLIQVYQAPGLSLLAGAVVLSIMILPTITLMTEASLRSIPQEIVENAASLGLSKSTTTVSVMLPLAAPGAAVGTLLAVARALGETIVVVMVCGNVARIPAGVLEPVRTLTANIALEMAYAYGDHRGALFFTGLVLMLSVLSLLLAVWGFKVKECIANKASYAF